MRLNLSIIKSQDDRKKKIYQKINNLLHKIANSKPYYKSKQDSASSTMFIYVQSNSYKQKSLSQYKL
jgi:hypothetical protein